MALFDPPPADPKQRESWRQFAQQLGADFIESGTGQSGPAMTVHGGVMAQVAAWKVTLVGQTFYAKNAVSHVVQAHACFLAPVGFRFSLDRKGVFLGLGKALGFLKDLEVGDLPFDTAFVIRANNELGVRDFFADADLRQAIQSHPSISLSIRDQDAAAVIGQHAFPPNVDVLVLEVREEPLDVGRLDSLYRLMVVSLERLAQMGIALRDPPGLEIRGPLVFTPAVVVPPQP
jgi:hypothetical protein